MNDSAAAIARFRAAQDRRLDEIEEYRNQLANAPTLRDYLSIQHANRTPPLQTTANMAFAHLKKRRA